MKAAKKILITTIAVLTLLQITPAFSQAPPPYIQPGIAFVYRMVDMQTQQPENLFHRYIIESATAQGIVISIQSDVVKPHRFTVRPNGEIQPGVRIDLWLPPDIPAGTRFNFLGADVIVVQRGIRMQQVVVTVVATADQSIIWLFIDDGPSPLNQLKGLLLAIIFNQKKALTLVNIEQAGSFPTTTTYRTTYTTPRTTASATVRTTVREGRTETVTETVLLTTTVVETRTETRVTTVTTSTTATVQPDVQQTSQPIFPLPLAIGVAVGIVGAVFFISRARKRPLPPTYPYPVYGPPPPTYPQYPQPQQPAVAGYCPACRFPIYAGDVQCRRCGFRFA